MTPTGLLTYQNQRIVSNLLVRIQFDLFIVFVHVFEFVLKAGELLLF